jgi:hypothetical protein
VAILLIGLNMDKDNKDLVQMIHIKDNIKIIDLMGSEHTNGIIKKQFIKEVLKTDLDTEKENGHQNKPNI